MLAYAARSRLCCAILLVVLAMADAGATVTRFTLRHKDGVPQTAAVIGSSNVTVLAQCSTKCAESYGCGSFNVDDSPQPDGWRTCELRERTPYSRSTAAAGVVDYKKEPYWELIPGSVSDLSIGEVGLWACQSSAGVYCRINTRKNGGSAGSGWKSMGTGLTHVSSGNNSLWGINNAGAIYHRSGISDATPYGTGWDRVSGSLLQVSVNSVNNEMWGIGMNSYVHRRRGITATNHIGMSWQAFDFIEAKWVSVGQAGVWTTSSTNEVFYRTGTGNGVGGEGIGWEKVDGSLKQVSSGDGVVWGVDVNGNIFIRIGIDDTHGNGTEWQRVPGSLTQVSVSSASNYVWGLNGQSVYRRMF